MCRAFEEVREEALREGERKKAYPASVGGKLRKMYEQGKIINLEAFKEALKSVLSDCEK